MRRNLKPLVITLALAAHLLACGPKPWAVAGPPPMPLHLAPACDLAPAAGVQWVVEAKREETRLRRLETDGVRGAAVLVP